MGKKKKIAKTSIKILKSGKLKVGKGVKIDLKPFVKESIANSIVSRLDGIISKEDVIVDTAELRVDLNTQMASDIKTAELASRVSDAKISTVVVTVNKKDAMDSFDFLNDGTLGNILRTSTLASIYSNNDVKGKWEDLNKDDTTSFINVMFIPKVMIFIDEDTGKIRKNPYYINVLILSVPAVKKMSDGVEELSDEDADSIIISGICDAAIKCGAKDLILNPYGHKVLLKDPHTTARLWNDISTTQRFIEQFNSIIFTLENEELFITFNAVKTK